MQPGSSKKRPEGRSASIRLPPPFSQMSPLKKKKKGLLLFSYISLFGSPPPDIEGRRRRMGWTFFRQSLMQFFPSAEHLQGKGKDHSPLTPPHQASQQGGGGVRPLLHLFPVPFSLLLTSHPFRFARRERGPRCRGWGRRDCCRLDKIRHCSPLDEAAAGCNAPKGCLYPSLRISRGRTTTFLPHTRRGQPW